MAAEWTYLVSYAPAHILISIGPTKTTAENIQKTKKFGVSIASEKQNGVASVAGGSAGREFDKIAALKEMGVTFSKAKNIDVLLVEGSSLMAECEVVETIQAGDKTLFLGKVLTAHTTSEKPLAYHQNKYWKMDTLIEKPSDGERAKMNTIIQKHSKKK